MIEVDHVSKVYVDSSQRGVRALHDVSFEIREGEFVALLGPSGCGKSTLLSIIAGLLPPSDGGVTIDGVPVGGPQTNTGIVFQRDVLLEWRTALQNVLLQTEARKMDAAKSRGRALELLTSMGLSGFEGAWPKQLSGGMRQRVAICRALVHDPPILLMDEPFGALDAITRDQLGLDLVELWDTQRRTAIFVTHSIAEAVFLSDRVVVMTPRPGRIADVIDVGLDRPRTLAMRDAPAFLQHIARIREIFLGGGILRERRGGASVQPAP